MASRLPTAGLLAWRARVEKVEVEEISLGYMGESSIEIWGSSIEKQRQGAMVVFMDRSRDEKEGVGGGWYWKTEQGEEVLGLQPVGPIVTVWDGEIQGVLGALQQVDRHSRLLLLLDLQAAIQAIRNAGRIRQARTEALVGVLDNIHSRQ